MQFIIKNEIWGPAPNFQLILWWASHILVVIGVKADTLVPLEEKKLEQAYSQQQNSLQYKNYNQELSNRC